MRLIPLLLLFAVFGFGFIPKEKQTVKPELQWLSLPEALEKSRTKPRKILIDVYTDWCGYCKRMDRQVYSNPEVVALLLQEYYTVKLNAEHRGPITINGTTYQYLPQYKAHALALSLLKGEMSYPSTLFLDSKLQVRQRVAGFIPARDLLASLKILSAY